MPVLYREGAGVERARRGFEASKLSTGDFLFFSSYVILKVDLVSKKDFFFYFYFIFFLTNFIYKTITLHYLQH